MYTDTILLLSKLFLYFRKLCFIIVHYILGPNDTKPSSIILPDHAVKGTGYFSFISLIVIPFIFHYVPFVAW